MMDYTLSLTRPAFETLQAHLLGDRSREQMAITLCGVNRLHRELRLLVRDVVLLPPDAFRQQTAAQLELKPEVQAFVHQRAHRHGLVQVDWHSHVGSADCLAFSSTDDRYEAAQAAYLAHRMDGVPYGSVVVADGALDARLWVTRATRQARGEAQAEGRGQAATVTYHPEAHPLQAIFAGDLDRRVPATTQRLHRARAPFISPIFDRQVRAFGRDFQRKLGRLRVGLVGAGGLGSAIVEYLARMGVREWVLVDPDVVELSNLNRLVNATTTDAQRARPKVNVARSTVRQSNPKAYVRALQTDVFDPEAQRALKSCDLLVVATDNHGSRMALNRLAVQYLIPLVHLGFNITVEESEPSGKVASRERSDRKVTDVSGEFAIPDLGRWCLQCAGIVDPQQAGWELAPAAQRDILRQRGYVADTPAPAVRHLDGLVAALAAAEIHNLVHAFKPQHRYLAYDALRTELVPLQVTPSQACPVCSPDHGVLGLGDLEPMPDYRRASQALPLPPPPARAPQARASEEGPQPVPVRKIAPSLHSPQAANTPGGQPGGQSMQLAAPIPASPPPDRRTRVRRLQTALDEFDDPDWPLPDASPL
jgi:hypothetical protein